MRRPEQQVVHLATRASELLAAMIFRPAPDVTGDRSGTFDEQEKTSRKEVTMPERYESSDLEKVRGLPQEGGGLMRFIHHQAKSPFALRKVSHRFEQNPARFSERGLRTYPNRSKCASSSSEVQARSLRQRELD
jgi:hypothetical protein